MKMLCWCLSFSILRVNLPRAWEIKLVERELAKWDIFVYDRG